MRNEIIKKISIAILVFVMVFSNLPFQIISQTLVTYQESRNIVDKFWNIKSDRNVVDNLKLFELAKRLKVEEANADATTNGTVWYLSNTNAATAYGTTGPTAEYAGQTDVTPAVPTLKSTALAMTDTPGTAAVTRGGLTAAGNTWFRTFLSPQLAAQTLNSGMTFRLALSATESNVSANAYTRTHVYVWREGSGYVATLIDGTAANCVTATEYGTTGNGRVCVTSATASNVTLQAGDQIAVEVWVQAAAGYTENILYGGPIFVSHSVANTNPLSSFGTSRAVVLQSETTQGNQWYLSNTNAATAYGTTGPTAEYAGQTDVTPAVPTLKSTALAMTDTPGTSVTTVGGIIGTGNTWFRTFLSPRLAAQTINSGMTFRLELAPTESSTSANSFTRTHVYVWREGTGYVATLIDGTAANCVTATEYGTTANGRDCVTSATASNVTLQDGDQIAVEVWVQSVTGYTSNILYGGPTFIIRSLNNTTPMASFATSRALTLQTAVANNTTLSNFVTAEPGNSIIAPSGSGLVDSFGLVASSGTDTVTAATVTLATGMGQYVQSVAITDNNNITTYCSAAPTGDLVYLTGCTVPVTVTNTQFKIKITAISHVSMPAPSGGSYAVTGRITAFTSTNNPAGSDSGSSTLTIDNTSPGATTGASATPGDTNISLSWTNPGDSDFQKIIIYCKTSAITEAPTEGTDPAVDGTACDGTARVKYSGSASPQVFTGLANGVTYYFRIYARDTNGNFTSYAASQQVSATPVATLTLTIASTAGSQAVNLNSGDTSKFITNTACTSETDCAAFKLSAANGTVTVTSIKVTETGSAAANTDLSNPTLIYDTDTNYSNGTSGTFGTLTAFASDQTATFSNAGLAIPSGSSYYFYIRIDLRSATPTYPSGGQTMNFQIANNTDIVTSGAPVKTGAPATLAGSTTVKPVVVSYTNSTESSLNYVAACTDCGARIGPGSPYRQTIVINGYGFGSDPGLGSRDTATNKVEIVGAATDVLSDDGSANTNVSAWNNTSITIRTDSNIAGNTDSDFGTNYGGANALKVTAGSQSTPTNLNFYLFPQVTSLTVPTAVANAAREYNASDSDGVITLNGTRFGSSATGGWVRILGCDSSTCSSPSGSATTNSWNSTAINVQIPTVIADNIYTGSVVMQQGSGSSNKSHTYTASGFRILPRLTSLDPATGIIGATITLNGNHFCQNNATCPVAFDTNNKIVFTSNVNATVFTSWSNTAIVTAVPSGAVDGNVYAVSNTYNSNNQNFGVLVPNPDSPTSLNQYIEDTLSSSLAVGSTASSTNLYLTMSMRADISGGTLYPQIEYKPVGTAFSCTGTSACAQATEGTGKTGPGPVDCNLSANACAITISPSDDVYHWQARVRYNQGGSDYYSAWVPFGGNSESATDFKMDKTAPVITFPGANTCNDAVTQLSTNGATISWNLSEPGTGQIEYSKNSNLSSSILTTISPSNTFHSFALNNLDSNATYYFQVKSADSSGNTSYKPSVSPFCSFATSNVTQPAKTTKFFVDSLASAITGGTTNNANFSVYVPENSVAIKSAFLELSGFSPSAGTNNISLSVNGQATSTYAVASNANSFRILYKIDPANVNFDPVINVFSLNPSLNTNLSSAILFLTYSFAP